MSKEKTKSDVMYYMDRHGTTHTMLVKDYEAITRSGASVNERLGVVTGWKTPDVSGVSSDSEQAPAKNPGEPVYKTGGEDTTEITNSKR